jgi:hypothetical protein
VVDFGEFESLRNEKKICEFFEKKAYFAMIVFVEQSFDYFADESQLFVMIGFQSFECLV